MAEVLFEFTVRMAAAVLEAILVGSPARQPAYAMVRVPSGRLPPNRRA